MSDPIKSGEPEPDFNDIPEAVVQPRTQISIVWLIPMVAAVIGGWLAFKAISEQGPVVTITFRTAQGLEAGQTRIKYKEVEIGKVESIGLSQDLSRVVVTAKLVKGTEPYLTQNTQFWVVRARVSAGEVSGLGTLFSGAYIGIDPGKEGEPERNFKGLEKPPVLTADLPGRRFALKAVGLGSLDIGSPVYHRQIKVGRVIGYDLEKDAKTVTIQIFVDAPHDRLVRRNTKFWNASGLDMSVDAGGIRIKTESLVTLVLGGIVFETPAALEPDSPAVEDDVFILFTSREKIYEKSDARKEYFILLFTESVRGLTIGAPVELRGIEIGQVVGIKAEMDLDKMEHRIKVLIEIDPADLAIMGEPGSEKLKNLEKLVANGLRARLKTGNYLTGKLLVDFDFHPDAAPVSIVYGEKYAVLPTLPAQLQIYVARLDALLTTLEKLPLEQIGQDLKDTMAGADRLINSSEITQTIDELKQTLAQYRLLADNANTKLTPELESIIKDLDRTIQQVQSTVAGLNDVVSIDSPLYLELHQTLKEMAKAARSVNVMVDYLEQHPEAILKGKGN